MSITEGYTDENERYREFLVINKALLPHSEILELVFNKLYSMDRFINFGFNKVLMVFVKIEGKYYSFHHNVVLSNDTSFSEYYDKVADHIITKFDDLEK